MDQFDRATEIEERERAHAQTVRKPEGPAAIGVCHNCAEPLSEGMRWCDSDCRADWEQREQQRRQRC